MAHVGSRINAFVVSPVQQPAQLRCPGLFLFISERNQGWELRSLKLLFGEEQHYVRSRNHPLQFLKSLLSEEIQ